MYATTETWSTPLLTKGFNWSSPEAEIVEKYVIDPAVKRIVNNMVSERLMALNPLNGAVDSLLPHTPVEDWDSSLRFTYRMQRVLPFNMVLSPAGMASDPNPAFQEPGLVVFSRSAGAYSFDVKRRNEHTNLGQRVSLWIEVSIPDESVFETEWFRLK